MHLNATFIKSLFIFKITAFLPATRYFFQAYAHLCLHQLNSIQRIINEKTFYTFNLTSNCVGK